MKANLPNAVFIGFTGTPLLKADKARSIEIFGRYIHTYKFDEAIKDKVILDLRYEAQDIDQSITSQHKIDQWFEAKVFRPKRALAASKCQYENEHLWAVDFSHRQAQSVFGGVPG